MVPYFSREPRSPDFPKTPAGPQLFLIPILQRGYAVASTDTGHESTGADARWAMGHPENQIDFGYRAVHEMTLRAKEIVSKK